MKTKIPSIRAVEPPSTSPGLFTPAIQLSPPGFLRLPFEIRTMIWTHVLTTCTPEIVIDSTQIRHKTIAYRVRTTDDKRAKYPPHPLCYVCRHFSAEFQEQLYNTTLFHASEAPNIWNQRCPNAYQRVVRLHVSMHKAIRGLQCSVPPLQPTDHDNNGTNPRKLILPNLPHLKSLSIDWKIWWPDANFECWPGDPLYTRYQRLFTRLIYYKRSFDLSIRVIGIHLNPYLEACVGTITGTEIKYVYHEEVKRNEQFERNVERVVLAGWEGEGRRVLEEGEDGEQHAGGRPVGSKDSFRKSHGIGFVRGMFKGRSWKR